MSKEGAERFLSLNKALWEGPSTRTVPILQCGIKTASPIPGSYLVGTQITKLYPPSPRTWIPSGRWAASASLELSSPPRPHRFRGHFTAISCSAHCSSFLAGPLASTLASSPLIPGGLPQRKSRHVTLLSNKPSMVPNGHVRSRPCPSRCLLLQPHFPQSLFRPLAPDAPSVPCSVILYPVILFILLHPDHHGN